MLNYQRVWYAKCQTSSNMPKTKNLPKINDQIKWSWGLDWTQLLIGTLSIKNIHGYQPGMFGNVMSRNEQLVGRYT